MADRRVTRTGKDSDRDITALSRVVGTDQQGTEAIIEIEAGVHKYYVQDGYSRRATVQVVHGRTGKYLRTDPNSSCSDNLDNLPNC